MDAGKKCHGLNIYLSFTGLLVRPQTLTGGTYMYGKNVTVDGITVLVFGCPKYTQDQWEEKARKIIANMKEAV